jgi:pyruvate formate lyase activating enzyme
MLISKDFDTRFKKEALLFEELNGKIQCNSCQHRCQLNPGQKGCCKTRQNIDGKLYTLIYGDISSISNNYIEKKPLYHFYPGSRALTVGSWSCNFKCDWCQNYRISKVDPEQIKESEYYSPEDLIRLALEMNSQGLSYSFNEPTLLLEHSIEAFKLAKKNNLYNTYVSNGYMTLESLDCLIDAGLDAINIDIKGDKPTVRKYCNGDLDKILRNAVHAKEKGVHVELTTLIIPKINQEEKQIKLLSSMIKNMVGEDTPWHLSRYFPHYKYFEPPTDIEFIKKSKNIAKNLGLNYVYLGNIPGMGEDTYCPVCGTLLIERNNLTTIKMHIKDNKCPECGEFIVGSFF